MIIENKTLNEIFVKPFTKGEVLQKDLTELVVTYITKLNLKKEKQIGLMNDY